MSNNEIFNKYPAAKPIHDLIRTQTGLKQAILIQQILVGNEGLDIRLQQRLHRNINHIQIYADQNGGYNIKFFNIVSIEEMADDDETDGVNLIATCKNVAENEIISTLCDKLNLLDAVDVDESDIEKGKRIIEQLYGLPSLTASLDLKRHYICKRGVVLHFRTLAKEINAMQIVQDYQDYYSVDFYKHSQNETICIEAHVGVGVEQLQGLIESVTENLIFPLDEIQDAVDRMVIVQR